jgi:hypothetical protein
MHMCVLRIQLVHRRCVPLRHCKLYIVVTEPMDYKLMSSRLGVLLLASGIADEENL